MGVAGANHSVPSAKSTIVAIATASQLTLLKSKDTPIPPVSSDLAAASGPAYHDLQLLDADRSGVEDSGREGSTTSCTAGG